MWQRSRNSRPNSSSCDTRRLSLCAHIEGLLEVLPGVVGVVLGVDPVADHEELHELKQPLRGPVAVPLVAVHLVEGLFEFQPPAFEFDLHQRQAVDQDRDIVAVFVGTLHRHLTRDLEFVLAPVDSIHELQVGRLPIVAGKVHSVAEGFGPLEDGTLAEVVDDFGELIVRKHLPIMLFQLPFQVSRQGFFVGQGYLLVALLAELLDEVVFMDGFGLGTHSVDNGRWTVLLVWFLRDADLGKPFISSRNTPLFSRRFLPCPAVVLCIGSVVSLWSYRWPPRWAYCLF